MSQDMEETLKQDEIDALFQAARTSVSAVTPDIRSRVTEYSFASAGQISTEQLRAISMLNDLIARNLTHNLSAWLRTRIQVNLVSAEQTLISSKTHSGSALPERRGQPCAQPSILRAG